ncbi:DUF4873 domain-containing protein [Mycolicibacter minnesotensis]
MTRAETLDVVVVGDPARLHGLFDGARALDPATVNTRFDGETDTWTVICHGGEVLTTRILIDTARSGDAVVAAHGSPNRFRIPGPHTLRQARYVARLVDGLHLAGAGRIESRSPRLRVHRLLPTRGLSRFYLTGSVAVDDEIYDGPAILTHRGQDYPTRVRLTGYLDPIDGQYHWQGMFFAELPGDGSTGSQVRVRIGEHTAGGRIVERTPWGTLTVTGAAGYPPFPLEDVEVMLPPAV